MTPQWQRVCSFCKLTSKLSHKSSHGIIRATEETQTNTCRNQYTFRSEGGRSGWDGGPGACGLERGPNIPLSVIFLGPSLEPPTVSRKPLPPSLTGPPRKLDRSASCCRAASRPHSTFLWSCFDYHRKRNGCQYHTIHAKCPCDCCCLPRATQSPLGTR